MKLFKYFLLPGVIALLGLTACVNAPPPLTGLRDGTEFGLGDGVARTDGSIWFTYYENIDYGKQIKVTVTVERGYITDVVIDPDHDESPSYVGHVIANAPAIIMAKNAFTLENSDIDANTRATLTIRGINQAGKNALDKLRN